MGGGGKYSVIHSECECQKQIHSARCLLFTRELFVVLSVDFGGVVRRTNSSSRLIVEIDGDSKAAAATQV